MAYVRRLSLGLAIVFFLAGHAAGLRMAVMRTECLTEEVSEGDMVTGSFVVLDHQSAWAEQHPGMDLGVSSSRVGTAAVLCNDSLCSGSKVKVHLLRTWHLLESEVSSTFELEK